MSKKYRKRDYHLVFRKNRWILLATNKKNIACNFKGWTKYNSVRASKKYVKYLRRTLYVHNKDGRISKVYSYIRKY